MSEGTLIQWADMTFNPWLGCTKVSEGCKNCYAEFITPVRVQRHQGNELWGKGKPRKLTSEATWRGPVKWNAIAQPGIHDWQWIKDFTGIGKGWTHQCSKCGFVTDGGGIKSCRDGCSNLNRPRVFPSACDWLDDEVPIEWLADFLKLIHDTPHLDWLLLTKRPGNWRDRISLAMQFLDKGVPRATEAEEKEILSLIGNVPFEEFQEKTAKFKRTPASLWLGQWLMGVAPANVWFGASVENQEWAEKRIPLLLQIPARVRFLSCEPLLASVTLDPYLNSGGLHWVIVGGESGPNARPCNVDWIRGLVLQCQAAKVAVFVKQLGKLPFYSDGASLKLADPKGGNMAEWSLDLQVREMPVCPPSPPSALETETRSK